MCCSVHFHDINFDGFKRAFIIMKASKINKATLYHVKTGCLIGPNKGPSPCKCHPLFLRHQFHYGYSNTDQELWKSCRLFYLISFVN